MSTYDLSRPTALLGIAAHKRMNDVANLVLSTKSGLVFNIRVHSPNELYDRYCEHEDVIVVES